MSVLIAAGRRGQQDHLEGLSRQHRGRDGHLHFLAVLGDDGDAAVVLRRHHHQNPVGVPRRHQSGAHGSVWLSSLAVAGGAAALPVRVRAASQSVCLPVCLSLSPSVSVPVFVSHGCRGCSQLARAVASSRGSEGGARSGRSRRACVARSVRCNA